MTAAESDRARSLRIRELDALRGIAALMVVLYHFTTVFDRKWGHDYDVPGVFALGNHGVELFFIISGFVIYMTLERRPTAGAFAFSRFARLFPSYWVAVLLSFAVIGAIGLPDETGSLTYHFALGDALANLTMLHWAFGIPDIDGVYWTLIVELAFYAVMLLLLRLDCLDEPKRAAMAIVTAGCGTVIVVSLLSFTPATSIVATGVAIYAIRFALYGNLFLAGVLFYRLRAGGSRRLWIALLFTLAIEGVVRRESVLLVAPFYGAFVLLNDNRLHRIAIPPLLWLGAISYPLYLVHQRIGYVVIHRLEAVSIDNAVLLFAVPLVVVLALATAIHVAVELPAQRALRARFRVGARHQPALSPAAIAIAAPAAAGVSASATPPQ